MRVEVSPDKKPPFAHRINPTLLERARAMRSDGAQAERILWWCLRNRRLDGLKFRRQTPIGQYVADFYCAEQALIIELDGESHIERVDYDESRTRWLEQRGYRVVRFLNDDVYNCIEAVLLTILRECGRDVSRM